MKHLILLRHAKSCWKDSSLSDHDRPLNKRGKRTAPIMGQRLSFKSVKPQHIISSTAKRALDTAIIVAKAIEYPIMNIETHKSLFHAWPNEMFEVMLGCNDTINHLMLVGHNPGMTIFANHLLGFKQFENIPTAGLVMIGLDINSWSELSNKSDINTYLIDYDYPKLNHSSS